MWLDHSFPYSLQVLSKRHVDLVTAQAWLLESKELEEKVRILRTSMHIGFLFVKEKETKIGEKGKFEGTLLSKSN